MILYMNIQDLPKEIKNKIFYYYAEHPCAKMIKDIYREKIITEVECHTDEHGYSSLKEIEYHINVFQSSENIKIINNRYHESEGHWNNLIKLIKNRKRYREELGDHFHY